MTKNLEIESSAWETCPPGELQRSQDRLALRESRKSLAQLSGVVVCAVVLVAVGVQARSTALSQPPESMAAGISCSDVHEFAGASGSANVDAQTREKIAAHLGECPHCRTNPATQYAQLKLRKEAIKAGEISATKSKPHCD